MEEKELSTLGARLEWARNKKNMTQTKLADMLNVTQGAIEKAENDKVKKPKFLPEAGKVLGVTYDWLLTGKKEIPNQSALSKEQHLLSLLDDLEETIENMGDKMLNDLVKVIRENVREKIK